MNQWDDTTMLARLHMREIQDAAARAHLIQQVRAAQPRELNYLRRRLGTLLIAAGESLACTCSADEAPCPDCA